MDRWIDPTVGSVFLAGRNVQSWLLSLIIFSGESRRRERLFFEMALGRACFESKLMARAQMHKLIDSLDVQT
jgi:hypothetical protein